MNQFLNRTIFRGLGAAFFVLLLPASLLAQMGNDNPTGVSGMYNGNVNTAGSYDPYTGNATRSITDISVAGSVGAYPLAFTRTMSSRYNPSAGLEFGPSGSWRHSYQWSIESHFYTSSGPDRWSYLPNVYTVNYPDGRRLSFYQANNDTRFRAGSGISDRFQQLTNVNGGMVYLLLPDGGQIAFQATVDRQEISEVTHLTESSFTYELVGIIDPYGQTTTVTYGANTTTIQEPAGRTLTLYYISTPWNGDTVVDRVVASDGRSVKYNYGSSTADGTVYTYLGNVQYLDTTGASYAQAIYAYQASNTDLDGRPLIHWAIDPMYPGPMWAISYSFVPASSGGVYGQLQSENYLDPFTGTPGQVVSSLSVNGNSRTETRGDGPSRTFNYSGGKLVSYTDFKGQISSISYDGNGFTSGSTDRRGKTTTTLREGLIGALSVLTHPDTQQSTQGYAYWTANGAPYHLQIRGDERGHNTYFTRDPNNFRLTRIDYPDYPNGAYEEFTYNNFGQVLTHKKSSGGAQGFSTDTFYYDARGLMWASVNADGTTYYFYDGQDRLEHVTDPRSKTTWYRYNTRGQRTRVTHMDGSYAQYGYNVDGTLAWVADENHPGAETDPNQRTRYAYDVYKRVVSVTNPLNQTTSYVYAQDWANGYNQTTTNVKGAFSPMGKQVHYAYDENWQRTIMRVPPGSDPNDAWTFYGYDAAGNMNWTQNPRGHATTFEYDNRNRRISATDVLTQTTAWQYDTTSNLTRETRPDQFYRRAEYDSMNRVIDTYGFANEHIHYDRDLAGNIVQMVDPKNASYTFGYDARNRETSATYPIDATGAARTETWRYDAAGNMDLYKNPAGQYRHLFYDDRNRMYDAWWDNYAAPEIVVGYNAASRVTSVVTNTAQVTAETKVAFGYNDANRPVWEEQTLAGSPTRRIETTYDADGNRARVHVPGGYYTVNYDYTQRNELFHIRGDNPIATFNRDEAGNVIELRLDWAQGSPTNYTYDQLNRVTAVDHGNATQIFQHNDYQYDNLGREVATWREEQSNKGERFGYNAIGQLTSASYNADQVWTGNPLNATKTQAYAYTADTLNRQSVTENGVVTNYATNGMNQLTNLNGQAIGYDGNFNYASIGGWQFGYDAEGHLSSLTNAGPRASFVYDGWGRCVKRTIEGVPTLITYDGWNPILEWDQAANWNAVNVYGAKPDEILLRVDAAYGPMSFKRDRRGNVSFVLNGSTQIIEQYSYDAFGKPTIMNGSGVVNTNSHAVSAVGNRFMFQGREYFGELGLMDFRHRFYAPTLGRFLQSDPLGFGAGDANLFRYCGGDPVNRRDPYGLLDMWSILFNEFSGSAGTATTAPIVVTGTPVETATSAGMGPTGPVSVLDRIGGARGEGSARDTGGGGGNSSPSPGSSTTPTPTPTPAIPSLMPNYYKAVDQNKKEGVSNMLAGAGYMFLGAGIMTFPGGQLPGAFVFGSGLGAALYGFGQFNNADNNAAAEVWGR